MTDLLTVHLAGFGIMVTLLLGTIGLLLRLIGDVRADMREHRESTRANMREFERALREIGVRRRRAQSPAFRRSVALNHAHEARPMPCV